MVTSWRLGSAELDSTPDLQMVSVDQLAHIKMNADSLIEKSRR